MIWGNLHEEKQKRPPKLSFRSLSNSYMIPLMLVLVLLLPRLDGDLQAILHGGQAAGGV
jgi:hypothetical protein